jgi:hypothetical protein
MANIECTSAQAGVPSVFVDVDNITDAQVIRARKRLDDFLRSGNQISTAVADAFIEVVTACPLANPSDLWQHVIYRHLIQSGWNDNKWKRVSGFALERAFVKLYASRLQPHGIRMRIVPSVDANRLLNNLGIMNTRSTKVDLFLEGDANGFWSVFGAAHVKSSIAERIQDDVPASTAFMARGLLSIAITMDSKSYPPPHGIGINYGELGGRSVGVEKERLKRNYIEVNGQFDGLFSFNLRTPPSPAITVSGKRIYTMSFFDSQPDQFVEFLLRRWRQHIVNIRI